MDSQFPDSFDLIVVGTGMVESILSAAASRIGKKVLHIDTHSYYGGQWASFNLDSIQQLNVRNEADKLSGDEIKKLLKENEIFHQFGNDSFDITNLDYRWHIPSHGTTDNSHTEVKSSESAEVAKDQEDASEKQTKPNTLDMQWSQEKFMRDSRKFNMDLIPKLQYARGDFVELLISSNIARYSEFRNVSRVLTWLNGHLEVVPCSRSDVFSNVKVSVIEKRMLMKLLTSLNEDEKDAEVYRNKTFREYLKDKKLTPNLVHYVLYAISMSTDTTSCEDGIQNTKRFLRSLGRFGKTPFLFSMYGSGEMPQAFCRLSAVFGGIFALNQPIRGYSICDNQFKALTVADQRIEAEHIVVGVEKCPVEYLECVNKNYISRAIFITDKSIMGSEKEHLTLLLYPQEHRQHLTFVLELGTLTGTCPKDLYLVHMITNQEISPQDDFKHIVKNLFSTESTSNSQEKPRVLWSCYFSLPDSNCVNLNVKTPTNLFVCPGPDADLDLDSSIKKAKEIFDKMYPDQEFLPRAPDPEEIVIEGEDGEIETKNTEE